MGYRPKSSYYSKDPAKLKRSRDNLKKRGMTKRLDSVVDDRVVKAPDAYQGKPIEFIEDHFYVVETRGRIELLDFEKQHINDIFFSKPTKNLAVLGQPKKTGKSTFCAAVALYYLCNTPMSETYLLASDVQQTELVCFDKLVKSIRMNPVLRDLCKVKAGKGRIDFQDSFIQILSPNSSLAGINPSLIIAEELWSWTTTEHKRSWDELTNVPTRQENLVLVSSYAGYTEDEDSILFHLYEQGIAQQEGKEEKDERFYFVWYGIELCDKVPWVDDKYLAQQERRMPENTFKRMHRNEWASGLMAFVSAETLDDCTRPDLVRGAVTDIPAVVGIDIGLKHDCSAVVIIGALDDDTLQLLDHCLWTPKRNQTLDLEQTVEAMMAIFDKTYNLRAVYYDPYQFERSAQTLKKRGLPMREWPQTVANGVAMSQALQNLLTSAKLILYPDKEVRSHLLNAQIKEHERGWRIVKYKQSKKIDLAIAMAEAAIAAQDCLLLKTTVELVVLGPDDEDEDEDDHLFTTISEGSW